MSTQQDSSDMYLLTNSGSDSQAFTNDQFDCPYDTRHQNLESVLFHPR